QWGEHVEVVAPESLRQMMGHRASALAARYQRANRA
ncbi:MAG: hypothetical protein KDE31_32790, partial [Caldilineaceae bacterium]|nr:hypothetical protein [Caldilineaceae bacterium]